VRVFLDTNILVYAIDRADPAKRKRARAVMAEAEEPVLSAQVLAEFVAVVTRKLATPMSPAQALRHLEALRGLPVEPIDATLVIEAVELADRASLSHWDAMIVRAAVRAECDRIATEDLQHGALIDGVEIFDPFR
jgi:predicted nucleic acid-binding protein